MKKIVLAFALILGISAIADAQYKPAAGDKNLQVSVAPLSGSPISIVGITGRSWSSETSALRGTVFIGFSNESTVTQDEDGDADLEELKDTESSFSIAIAPGIEKHMAGTERLSPYVGAEVSIGITTTNDKMETQNGDDIITTETSGGELNLGLNGLAGFDYYIAENLFLGVEIGFGFGLDSPFTSTTTSDADGAEDVESNVGNTTSIQVGPVANALFRLGWILK
jgi:hypothetical protein